MDVLLDNSPVTPSLPPAATVAEVLQWVQGQLKGDQVVTKVELAGEVLEGPSLTAVRNVPLGNRQLTLTTNNRRELALSMLGKLAALVEWLGPQHREVAALLERGDSTAAFGRLGGIFSAWHQIQQSYSGLTKLLDIRMNDLPVRELSAEQVMKEFCRSLADLQKALENRDLVLLADILQYEMDGAVANWISVLEATLAVVDPQALAA